MMKFNIFSRKKTKIEQKNDIKPSFIADFYPFSVGVTEQDGTSFACLDRLASEFASLNYAVYDDKSRQKKRTHWAYSLLSQPNLEDSHFNFFYQSAIDYFNGGCFWLKSFVNGELTSLFRINPKSVTISRDTESGKRIFNTNGMIFTNEQIVYIPSRFNYSTLTGGASIFDAAKATFDTSHSLESYTQSSFANGVLGKRIVIDASAALPDMTEKQARILKDSFQAEYAGPQNASRPLLKKKGIEYSELGATADNRGAELSENRRFQEHEIAKIFGVPEGLLNVSKDTNLENVFTLFCEFGIRPIATQFTEAINSLLDDDVYFEFDYNGIMKVSLQQRIDAYSKQINNGLLSPNEARAKESLPPIEAGDNHFMPVNMMPLNDETIEAYMAKQKNEIANGKATNPTAPDSQHFGGGDDKS